MTCYRGRALVAGLTLAVLLLAGCPPAPPQADFTASPRKGAVPLRVRFAGAGGGASGELENHRWDFGDGAASNEPTPTHLYTERGLYTVSLQAEVAGQDASRTKPDYIAALGEFEVACANSGDFAVVALYIAGAGDASLGPNRVGEPILPGESRTLSQTWLQGQHIVSVVFDVDGAPESVSLSGNLHSVGRKEDRVVLDAYWRVNGDGGVESDWR